MRNPATFLGVACALLVLIAPVGGGVACADDFFVSVRAGSDRTGDGSRARPWKSVTHALQRVPVPAPAKVHRIVVDHGFYDRSTGERFPLVMRSGIVLDGLGGGTVALCGAGAGSAEALIEFPRGTVFGPETRVGGLFLCRAGVGIRIHGGTAQTPSMPTVEGVNAVQCGVGIDVVSAGERLEPVLRRCHAVENLVAGIRFEATSAGVVRARMVDCRCLINHGVGLVGQAFGSGQIELSADDTTVLHNGRQMSPATGIALLARSGGRVIARLRNAVVANHDVGIHARNEGGAGVYSRLLHATVTRNAYGVYLDPHGSTEPTVDLENSIVWGNSTADLTGAVRGQVSYTDFRTAVVLKSGQRSPSVGVDGNVDADPQFQSPDSGDFRLRPASPVLDCGRLGVADLPAFDLDGDLRVIDGDGDGNGVPDLGYDERTTLWLTGPARIRVGVALQLHVPSNQGFTYVGALSCGTRPGLPLPPPDPRVIPLNPDWLFVQTVYGLPPVATGFFGRLDAGGMARLQLNIPDVASIVGITVYGAAVTAASVQSGVHHISNPVAITFVN